MDDSESSERLGVNREMPSLEVVPLRLIDGWMKGVLNLKRDEICQTGLELRVNADIYTDQRYTLCRDTRTPQDGMKREEKMSSSAGFLSHVYHALKPFCGKYQAG